MLFPLFIVSLSKFRTFSVARSGPSDGTSLLFFLAWKQEWVNYRPGTYLFGTKIKFFWKKSPYVVWQMHTLLLILPVKGQDMRTQEGESRIVNPIRICSYYVINFWAIPPEFDIICYNLSSVVTYWPKIQKSYCIPKNIPTHISSDSSYSPQDLSHITLFVQVHSLKQLLLLYTEVLVGCSQEETDVFHLKWVALSVRKSNVI